MYCTEKRMAKYFYHILFSIFKILEVATFMDLNFAFSQGTLVCNKRQVRLCFSPKLHFFQNKKKEKFDRLSHKSVYVYVIKVLNINCLFMKFLSPEDNFCAVTLFSKDIGGLNM